MYDVKVLVDASDVDRVYEVQKEDNDDDNHNFHKMWTFRCCYLKSMYDVKVLVDASDVDRVYEVQKEDSDDDNHNLHKMWTFRKPEMLYTQEFMLTFSELRTCKGYPSKFDHSVSRVYNIVYVFKCYYLMSSANCVDEIYG
nr:hypothetical protein [Tanacetum cinerariifolium]